MVKTIERRALSDENTTIPIGKVYAEVKVAKVKVAEVKETELERYGSPARISSRLV